MNEDMKNTTQKSQLLDGVRKGRPEPAQHGAGRFTVSKTVWRQLGKNLGNGLDMMGLWIDDTQVHMAVYEVETHEFIIASHNISNKGFPSVGQSHAPAIRPERTIRDLYGAKVEGLPDKRPWLDHGKWPLTHPLKKKPDRAKKHKPYAFLAAKGEGLHQIPVGPVHAGIIEPGHFRFNCAGETVVRLEQRLGYTHKGIEKLLEGKTPDEAAPVCARISGDSTVAYSCAFARAVERAFEIEIPARARWLRALMAELERLANHFGDIGAICNDAAFAFLHAHFGLLREDVLQAAGLCFDHRLIMDCVIPGGVAHDLDEEGRDTLEILLQGLRERLPRLLEVYDNTPSLQNRTRNTGYLDPALARQFACGGFVGRASGRSFDARRDLACEPYTFLSFETPVLEKGDVDSRVWIRIREAEQSLSLCEQILRLMPEGEMKMEIDGAGGKPAEGVAVVEGFRGDILIWLRLDADGRISRCYPRDPSVFQWPLLEAVIENNIVADFPLCNKSFNCSYSGHDL